MDRRRYETAERAFAAAVHNGSLDARTHYRYSLLLQRPVAGGDSGRAGGGVCHAEIARGLDPAQPLYLLTEGQARMVAGAMDKGRRSSCQACGKAGMGGAGPHRACGTAAAAATAMDHHGARACAALGGEIPARAGNPGSSCRHHARAFAGPRPAPPRVVEAGPPPWPPPGTVLVYGHIRDVECRAGEKIVTLRTPRYTVRLREPAGRPATLYDKLKRLRGLECGTKGWEVNAVFKMLRGDPECAANW